MKIGIDASFLRRPGTGIGQVTVNFLRKLTEFPISNFQFPINDQISNPNFETPKFILYVEEPIDLQFPENFEVKVFLPKWWKRDDVPRRILWERALAKKAKEDGCEVFLSLFQSSTVFQNSKFKIQNSTDVRHIMIVHDIIPRLFPEYLGTFTRKLHFSAVERGIRTADCIVAVSETTKADLVSELGIPEERITVAFPDCDPSFRVGATPDDILRVMKKYALEPGYIYHGGGLEIRKNAERLLHAYAALRSKIQDTRDKTQGTENGGHRAEIPPLVISGKVLPATNRLATDVRGIVRKLGLEESVVVLGFVPDEDLPALYHGAAFFVYPSLYEGFGLPVLEAFTCGVPVLAGRAGSIPELAGDAALLVDPESEDAIRHGMERLLDDTVLREGLSEKGRSRARDFSWDTFTEKVISQLLDMSS